jgi:predicted DsbA family dithiol-disulfide isomerase
MSDRPVSITEFTDPTCPYAFSAAPALLALSWFYGDQLKWRRRMVVLSESTEDNRAKDLTADVAVQGAVTLGARYGMPLSHERPDDVVVSLPGNIAVKAVERGRPELADRYFRALQVAWHSQRRVIDRHETLVELADECGIEQAEFERLIADPAVLEDLAEDKRAARSPLPAATGPLDHKLAGPAGERRYTCPSLEFAAAGERGQALVAPGIQNFAVYEALLANVAPELERRAAPNEVDEVLEWAAWPLAAAEVAELMQLPLDEAEQLLAAGSAHEQGGYWSAVLGDQDQLAAGAASANRLVG